MNLNRVVAALDLKPLWIASTDRDVACGYASDMLSDVLTHAPKGALLATLQTHMSVVAVAVQVGLSGVVFTNGKLPEDPVIARAETENIPLYVSAFSTFDVAGRMYALGVKGRKS